MMAPTPAQLRLVGDASEFVILHDDNEETFAYRNVEATVNHVQIERELDALEAKTKADLQDTIKDAFESLSKKLRRNTIVPAFVNRLELSGFGDVTATLREALRAGLQMGRRDLREESGLPFYVPFGEWDESKHPRHEKGSDKGGQFAPSATASGGGEQVTGGEQVAGGKGRIVALPDGQVVFHFSHEKHIEAIREEGLRDSSNSMYGPGIYFTDKHEGFGTGYGVRVTVQLKPHKQLVVQNDTDVGRVFQSLIGVDQFGSSRVKQQLLDKGIGSLRTKVDDDWYTVVFDKSLIQSMHLDKAANRFVEEEDTIAHYAAKASLTPRGAMKWLDEKAFWATGILRDELLKRAQAILHQALRTGEGIEETIIKIREAWLPWLGDDAVIVDAEQLQPYRLETIVRTNMTESYNQGRLVEFRDPAMQDYLQGVRYSAIIDSRTTDICRTLDGLVFRSGDPDLDRIVPPNHFNCRSILVPVMIDQKIPKGEFATAAKVGRALDLMDPGFGGAAKYGQTATQKEIEL